MINYLAVIVAAVINMVIGFAWYSQSMFGKQWMALMGKSAADLKGGMKPSTYPLMTLSALVMAYVMANVVGWAGASTIGEGLMVGFWVWLGFVVTTSSANVLFEQRPKGLFYITVGYYLVSLVIMGALLAVWQ